MGKKIKHESFKLWITIERTRVFEDDTFQCKDLDDLDSTASCGEFDTEQEARDAMESISIQYHNQFPEPEIS